MEERFIIEGNEAIRSGNLGQLHDIYDTISQAECKIDVAMIFSKLFANACLHNQPEIVKWLLDFYNSFSDIDKIRLRPIFGYVRHIAKIKKYTEISDLLKRR